MPDFDTSSYPKPSYAAPMNPLQMMGTLANTQNALNQNALFGQEFAARKSIGQAYQQAIDPKTGELDTNKLTALVAGNPAAAFKTGEVAQQALERKSKQLQIDTQQLDLANKHLSTMNDALSSLLANPNTSSKDVISKVGDLIAEQRLTPQMAAQELSSMPSDPQGLRQWLTQHLVNNLGSQEKLNAIYGSPTSINTGGATNIMAVSPVTGARTIGVLPNTLSPGEAAAPRQTFVNGQPGTVPTSAVVTPTGQPMGASPGGQAAAGGMPGAAPSGPAGFLPSGPKLGQEAAANVAGGASAQQGVELQRTADSVPQRKAILGEMESAMANFKTGPGADFWNNAVARLNYLGTNLDVKGVAANEMFNKLSTQLVQSQFQALGGTGTDAKLDSAMHSNPNSALSQMGNKEILAMLKGNEDAISVKNRSWQTWLQQGHGPESYGEFSTEFNKVFDPRVFQSSYLNQNQKRDLLKGMTKDEQAVFRKSYNFAVDNGWISDPRGQ